MSVRVIAEIGWNFMGDLSLAESMVKAASRAGADVAKFQYWNPDRLLPGAWDSDGRREIYEKARLSEQKLELLQDMCSSHSLEFLVSAFNVFDAKMVKTMGQRSIKIPSHEVANMELHEYVSKNFETVIVSLGAGSSEEVRRACDIYNSSAISGAWVGMHCVSSYPVAPEMANLPRLKFIGEMVPTLGYSDHTTDIVTPALSVTMGAKVIEKHTMIKSYLVETTSLLSMMLNSELWLITYGTLRP